MLRGLILYKFIFGKFEGPKENAVTEIGIVNGRATSLPIPEYSQESKDLCASGRVEIDVVIGENGIVMQATAVSGDDLLFESGLEAAKKAKFRTYDDIPPIKTRGILVYNYPSETKCVDVGVVNKKAISLSKPIINGNVVIERPTEIPVRIVIDLSGTVVAARALKGHPLIRKDLENAARKARFSPALINSKPFKIKATIVYKVMPDRTVEF